MARLSRTARAALGLQTLEAEAPEGDYSSNVTPPSRPTRVAEPLALPAFYRGVVLITNMASPLVINTWRRDEQVDNSVVTQPDPWMTRRRFIARTVTSLVLHGNAYWLKLRAPNGDVVGLRIADRGRLYRTANGAKRYQLVIDNKMTDHPAADVEHLRFLEVPGFDYGLGPVQACRVALEGIAAVREYADNWFDSGDATNGVLSTDQRIDAEQRKAYKTAWYDQDDIPGAPAGPQLRVLGSGLTYTPYFLKPADAQWLEAQSWGVLDIARLLGLPGDYLLAAVEGSSLTYTNLEMIDTSAVKRTLLPDYLNPIEEALTNVIVRGQTARFELAEFLRPDAKTRADIDAIYLTQGVIGADEVRRREGWVGPPPTEAPPARAATPTAPTGAPA